MTWLLYALLAVVIYAFDNLLQRKIGIESTDPRATGVVFNLAGGTVALVIFLLMGNFRDVKMPTQPYVWIFLALGLLCYGLFERGRFYAAKYLDAAILDTILTISLVISFCGSVIFYHEELTVQKVLGASLIVIALIATTYAPKKTVASQKGMIIGVVVSILLGFAWFLDKQNLSAFPTAFYTMMVWTLPIVFVIFPSIKIKTLKKALHVSWWKILLLAGLNVVGYMFQLEAILLAGETRVLPVIQTSVLLTTVLAIFLLQEKDEIPRKMVGAVLALVGVLLLV